MTEAAWVKSISVRNVRNIHAETVHLAPFTVIVGQNGSGKSSLVDSFRFLAESVQHTPTLATHNQGGRQYFFRLFKLEDALLNAGLGLSVELGEIPEAGIELSRYEFDLDASDEARVLNESLSIRLQRPKRARRVPNLRYAVHSGSLEPRNSFDLRLTDSADPTAFESRLLLSFFASHPKVKPVFDLLSGIHVVTPDPRVIRLTWGRSSGLADPLGGDLSALLGRLRLRSKDRYEQIMAYAGQAVPYLATAAKQSGNQESLLVEADSELPLPYASLSDGSLRAISLIAGLFRDTRPGLVVIDEIEDGLHPGAVEALIRMIREIAVPNGKQVLLTTHNPYVLDLATTPALDGPEASVLVARRGHRGQATFTPAGEKLDRLIHEYQGRAGDYWLNGGFRDFPDSLAAAQPEDEPQDRLADELADEPEDEPEDELEDELEAQIAHEPEDKPDGEER